MFAPVGYTPASHLFNRLQTVANLEVNVLHALRYAADTDGYTERGALNGLTLSNLLFSRDAYPHWCMWANFYLQLAPPYLASKDGRVFRASPDICHGNNELSFDIFSPFSPSDGMDDLWELMRERNIAGENVPKFDRGWLVSSNTWCIRSFAEALEMAGEGAPPPIEIECLLRTAVAFEGWAVCFDDRDIPLDHDGLLRWGEELGADIRIPLPSEPSAPALRSSAGAAFVELFPDGRGGAPWKEVARQVAAKIGREVSVKTLMRAVSERTDRGTASNL